MQQIVLSNLYLVERMPPNIGRCNIVFIDRWVTINSWAASYSWQHQVLDAVPNRKPTSSGVRSKNSTFAFFQGCVGGTSENESFPQWASWLTWLAVRSFSWCLFVQLSATWLERRTRQPAMRTGTLHHARWLHVRTCARTLALPVWMENWKLWHSHNNNNNCSSSGSSLLFCFCFSKKTKKMLSLSEWLLSGSHMI